MHSEKKVISLWIDFFLECGVNIPFIGGMQSHRFARMISSDKKIMDRAYTQNVKTSWLLMMEFLITD